MLARLRAAFDEVKRPLDRSFLHTAIKASVAVALLSAAAHHVHAKRAFDKSGLERLATKASGPMRK